MDEPLKTDPFGRWQKIVRYHKSLLADERRNRAFFTALRRAMTKNSKVLDIGSGSGVWAVAAARLGAKRVVAIEMDEILIPIIYSHAKENRVEDKIEVIHGNSQNISLDEKFDVVISETIGDQGFEEGIVSIMIDARKRFLKKGGITIPRTVSLRAAPAHLRTERALPVGAPFKIAYLDSLAKNLNYRMSSRSRSGLLAEPKDLLSVDLAKVRSEPDYKGLIAAWDLENLAKANAVMTWARCDLFEDIFLDTWQTTNWAPVIYPLEPFRFGRGELRFELSLSDERNYWTFTAKSGRSTESKSYSPMFASARLDLDAKRFEADKQGE